MPSSLERLDRAAIPTWVETISCRLLIVSLDGLSLEQGRLLGQRLSCLQDNPGRFYKIDSAPLTSAQAIWAEILTGSRWSEVGCPGYARPASSLNDLQIVKEKDLLHPVTVLGAQEPTADHNLVINMPLLEPASGRLWLSDGSLPMETVVSPPELSRQAPFCNYRPRPFPSSTVALSDVSKGISDCLSNEVKRLDCFAYLVKTTDWKRCLLRISAFDLLAHLLGPEFLESENLSASSQISKFVSVLDSRLQEVKDGFPELSICLLSAFCHQICCARLNLNQLLKQGGFCKLSRTPADRTLQHGKRRATASRLLNTDGGIEMENAGPIVVETNAFDLNETSAGSPVQGCIYINRKDRFVDGIVEPDDCNDLIDRLYAYLSRELPRAFGSRARVLKNSNGHVHNPDLLVYIEGVEMHNSLNSQIFDYVNKPRSIHASDGFIRLPLTDYPYNSDTLDPLQVNMALRNLASASDEAALPRR